MRTQITGDFLSDLSLLKDKKTAQRIKLVIKNIEGAISLQEISGVKKLSNSKNAFRIRIGNYRLCFYLEKGLILIVALGHRKEIYRRFPQ